MTPLAEQNQLAGCERQRLQAQRSLDAARTTSTRNRLGQFATPFALALDIARFVDRVVGKSVQDVHFADPAIGTGSFFSAALAVFGQRRLKSATGIEIDSAFATAARDIWTTSGLNVIRDDFTRIVAAESPSIRPNLILANPPYVRHHHLPRDEKLRLQALASRMTGIEVSGLAGLYVHFLLLATAWMQDGGFSAWLVPSEFMDVNYGQALRRLLTEQTRLIRIHRFDPAHAQFDDALVSSTVLVFRKITPPNDHKVEFSLGGTIDRPAACECIALSELRQSRKWTAYPRRHSFVPFSSHNGSVISLADLFRVQRGIATGDNQFFVMDRCAAKRNGLPDKYLRPVLPSPRRLKTTVIDGDSDGYPLVSPQLCVIDCDLPEEHVRRRHPALWDYLNTARLLGVKDRYLVAKRNPWYRQEQREPCPFLCTYMGRGSDDKPPFRFILNRSQAIALNLYLMLYPQGQLAGMLCAHPERAVEVHEMLGSVTGHELRGEGRVYGGGLYKIEPRELGRISAGQFLERWPELAVPIEGRKQLTLY